MEHGLPFLADTLADTLHNRVRPSDPPIETADLLAMAARSWRSLGLRPKHHLASRKSAGPPGAHSARIDPADWREAALASREPCDFMIEAKDKDLALFELRKLGGLEGNVREDVVSGDFSLAHGRAAIT